MYDFFRNLQGENKKSCFIFAMALKFCIFAAVYYFLKMKRLLYLCCCCLAVWSCSQDEPAPKEHAFTEQELVKKHLDESFSLFFESLEVEEVEDWEAYVRKYSTVSVDLDGSVVYRFRKGSITQLSLRVRKESSKWTMEAQFYGGIRMSGRLTLGQFELPEEFPPDWNWHILEQLWDIDVYDNYVWVAKLGLESYAYTEAGKVSNIPILVFRFPDGTSYSVTTVLLVEPLMDYLIKNVFSTE